MSEKMKKLMQELRELIELIGLLKPYKGRADLENRALTIYEFLESHKPTSSDEKIAELAIKECGAAYEIEVSGPPPFLRYTYYNSPTIKTRADSKAKRAGGKR